MEFSRVYDYRDRQKNQDKDFWEMTRLSTQTSLLTTLLNSELAASSEYKD